MLALDRPLRSGVDGGLTPFLFGLLLREARVEPPLREELRVVSALDDPPAVERADGDQVEQVDQEAGIGQRIPDRSTAGPADDQADEGTEAS